MQVIYGDCELGCIKVDCKRVRQFLLEHGVQERKIDSLRIHIRRSPSAKQRSAIAAQGDGDGAWGLYTKPHDVYVFTNVRPKPMAFSLNETLIHELRHHMKNGYRTGEVKLPHKKRPSEIDAYAFAAEQAPLCTLVSIPGESPLSPAEDRLIQILAVEVLVCGLLGASWLLRRVMR